MDRQIAGVCGGLGEYFGIDRFLRIGFGIPEEKLTPALERVHDFIVGLG